MPQGWYHATVNLGDTGAIARRTEEFTAESSRGIGGRAISAVMRKKVEEGLELAEAAVKIDPKEGDHAINLGHALENAGRLAEAKASFQRATDLMPRNPGAYLTLGKLLNEMGEYRKAGGEMRACPAPANKTDL